MEVDKSTLAGISDLIESIRAADAIYHSCQAQSFRAFVHKTLEAPNNVALCNILKRMVQETENTGR